VFIAREDLTTPPNAEGYRSIICRQISDVENGRLAARGLNILRRVLLGVAGA